MRCLKGFYGIFLFLFSYLLCSDEVDLIVFSYDRPLQLYAFFESLEKHEKNLGEIFVIYKWSVEPYEKAYSQVKTRFTKPHWIEENSNKNSFRNLVFTSLKQIKNKYFMFAVDDIVVKDDFDCKRCVENLEKTQAFGFYLRLGKNITQCYMHNDEKTTQPYFYFLEKDIYKFSFQDGKGDWNYPFSIDMTIFNKEDIYSILAKEQDWDNPKNMEYKLACNQPKNPLGLCFEHSKCLNVPINLVGNFIVNGKEWKNRNMELYTTEELLIFFNQGNKIDISSFFKMQNISPHLEYKIKMIKR